MVATGLISPGWLVSDEYRKVLDGISSAADVQKHLVETDMREYGVSWLDSKKSKDVVGLRSVSLIHTDSTFCSNFSAEVCSQWIFCLSVLQHQ
ncbi:tudor domain-containing protein 3 [Sparganum proliferum]